jgi:uncharacterized membrane protein
MLPPFWRDPLGNSLAVVVLIGMLAALVRAFGALRAGRGASVASGPGPAWLIPALALAGLGVAGYLAYVETQAVPAVCGPVGDCNAVQHSPYARLFGLLPIGLLGLAGYAAILLAWLVWRLSPGPWADRARLALWACALFGTFFSVYLTFLEPFVIGATCAWCLASALLITAILLLAPAPSVT